VLVFENVSKLQHEERMETCMAFCQVIALVTITAELLLVTPVRRKAMLSNEVHLGSPDLDLHRDAVIPNHHGVEGAVAIGFGVLDVVLEAACHWPPQVMHLQCGNSSANDSKIAIVCMRCCLNRYALNRYALNKDTYLQ